MDCSEKELYIKERLKDFTCEVLWKESLGSTNSIAEQYALEQKECIVIADMQTEGKGRLERSFSSEKGGLYISLGMCLNKLFSENEACDLEQTLHFPLLAALAATDAVCTFCETEFGTGIIPDIKWPNDLQLNGKKMGGILCRAVKSGDKWYIIAGTGINIYNVLPEELTEATTIFKYILNRNIADKARISHSEQEMSILRLAAEVSLNTIKYFRNGMKDRQQLLDEIESRCITIGKRVSVPEKNVSGIAIQIGDDGSLCIEKDDGDYEVVKSGDVIISGD